MPPGDLRPSPSFLSLDVVAEAAAACFLGRYVVRGAYRLSFDRVVPAMDLRALKGEDAADGLGLGERLLLPPPPPPLLRREELMVGNNEWPT